MSENWHSLGVAEVLKKLKTSENGLSGEEAKNRLEKFGLNELKEAKKVTPLEIFIRQFKDFLILILVIAAIISAGIGLVRGDGEELIDAIAISVVVILIAIIGFFQEYKAERELEALKRMVSPEATVLRNGKKIKISAKELVPGDVILLEAGDKIPADSRVIESISLKVDESALTGESVTLEKSKISALGKETPLAERGNMVFMGTYVTYGKGKAIIVETGMKTEFGKIAEKIQEIEQKRTPLQLRLEKVGKRIGVIVLVICAIVFLTGILKSGFDLKTVETLFLAAVALAVAAIPEGLPGVVIVTLARGMREMLKRNVIVRKLPAVETLGSTSVICSDKTGTLTRNEMVVRKIFVNRKVISITGEGYKPEGEFLFENKKIETEKEKELNLLLKISSLNNDSSLEKDRKKWKIIGDPTEGALVVLGEKASLSQKELNEKYKRIFEFPFDSERKRMTTIHEVNKEQVAYMKGAPDVVLNLCEKIYLNGREKKLTKEEREKILKMNDNFAKNALRVLAFAYRKLNKNENLEQRNIEKNMIFVGLAGMIDPPRQDAIKAVKICRNAGIKTIMITGDHKLTAIAIGKEMDIFREGDKVLTGLGLDKLNDKELEKIVEEVKIYARVSPEHKLRIVKALKKKDEIVAMTGDGVNDALALKKSDIGVAMGITGTEVTKEASDMVLLDDNFASIVSAVEEGRSIYDNIRLFIRYLLSCNMGEVLTIFLGILFFPILPLIPIQILWMNLVTDAAPALALGFNTAEPDVMRRKPRNPREEIINKRTIFNFLGIGTLMCLGTLFLFSGEVSINEMKAQTMAFTTLIMFQLFFVLSCRSEKRLLIKTGFFSNKWLIIAVLSSLLLHLGIIYLPVLQEIFKTVALSLGDWMRIVGISFLGFLVPELWKLKK